MPGFPDVAEFARSLTPVSSRNESAILPSTLQASYREFLSLCDGGYTPDRIFHFFGTGGPRQHDVVRWNDRRGWRRHFAFMMDDRWWPFAEDLFGNQFCFSLSGKRDVVKVLDPVAGGFTLVGNDFRQFLRDVVIKGWREAKEFLGQCLARPGNDFRPFHHLTAKRPLILGGPYEIDNFEWGDSWANMSISGQILSQVRSVPPGTPILDVEVDDASEEVKLIY